MKLNTYSIPISVKGIVTDQNKVWLRKNPRGNWELPGGKLDKGEQPEETVIREIKEELGFEVEAVRVIDAHVTVIKETEDEKDGVLILVYLCKWKDRVGVFEIESEGGVAEFKKFTIEELEHLVIPNFHKQSIKKALGPNSCDPMK